MSKQIEAMKLALKTLEQWDDPFYKRGRAIAVLQEALAEQPAQQQDGPINEGWQITVANGHSGYGVYAHMEDYPEEGAVLVQAIEQPAQQEPVAFYRCNGCGHAYEQVHPTSCDCMEGSSFEQVNYYTSLPASKPWVGLTEDEFDYLRDNNFGISPLISAVEAKLKEKNT